MSIIKAINDVIITRNDIISTLITISVNLSEIICSTDTRNNGCDNDQYQFSSSLDEWMNKH